MSTTPQKNEAVSHMVRCLLGVDVLIESNAQGAAEYWSQLLNTALKIYHGPDHAQAHQTLLRVIPQLKYKTSLILFGQFHSPMTPDILEMSIMFLAQVLQGSGWDGTAGMLHCSLEEWPCKDPYLSGHIGEHFCLDHGTPQEVMFTARRFFGSETKTVVRATLTVICGWLSSETFVDAEDFLQELQTLAQNSDDESVKRQVQEIFEQQEYNTSPD